MVARDHRCQHALDAALGAEEPAEPLRTGGNRLRPPSPARGFQLYRFRASAINYYKADQSSIGDQTARN
ncbi:hypothetical protein EVAR_2793_1 [Eumeta japonica]|uniref:Uncharacterized protein n=1 Tax=Eumeta variegata TaxID=151549 RepID=A0A4C1T2I2_EUMVA|nr:hypothetical protein EVAR_2793_1 [Eumeta japonica]